MIQKILIANRGEIACRIIRTSRRLKIKTVAVYSEIDRGALHVALADEAYCIGPPAAKDSYLNITKIIDILDVSGADAVHPGYGFLSENPDFARAVEAAGAIFIGPSPTLIHDMGDKLRAKEIARAAGVPLIPGSTSPVTTPQEVTDFTHKHGYPILLKAAVGGGGKGMRVVRNFGEIEEALISTMNESLSSFNDARVFIEKFIEHPRHIEIQLIGDTHGNLFHLGERDCSLQRRHQKVVEETPAPNLDETLRTQLIEAALKLGRHMGYFSAGTVEFIVSPDQQFYFLEVNTRLQVEHPITEWVYGLDLVELMIRVAAGQPLNLNQTALIPQGHALEVRLYAEDGDNGFLPSSGRLTHYHQPPPHSTLRIDSGVREGDTVSIHYDPMIAKVIVRAPDRPTALSFMHHYLSQFVIEGVDCNLNYLQRLLADPDVTKGSFNTNTIEDKADGLCVVSRKAASLPLIFQHQLMCIALTLKLAIEPGLGRAGDWIGSVGNAPIALSYCAAGRIHIKDEIFTTSLQWRYQHLVFECQVNEETIIGKVIFKDGFFYLTVQGQQFCVFMERAAIWPLLKYFPTAQNDENNHLIRSPMPGTLLSVHVAVGDTVKRGQRIAVIEAMKMENTLKAPIEGTLVELCVSPGESLLKSQIIARFG